MKSGRTLSFYIEIVVMLVISVLVITVIASAFSKSEMYSRNARRLSDAVTLAASGAEVFLAVNDIDELCKVLNEADNASIGSDNARVDSDNASVGLDNFSTGAASVGSSAPCVTVYYNDDLEPAADGNMKMVISWDENEGLTSGTVTVFYKNEFIYDLETAAAKTGSTKGAGR